MRFRMGDEREPAVVRDVEPLVRVGRPGVGALRAGREPAQSRGGAGPQPECTVDVYPGTDLAAQGKNLLEGVERARVHLARLRADDRRDLDVAKCRLQRLDAHATLAVDRDAASRAAADPDETEGAVDRHVTAVSGDDRYRRRSCETVVFHVPAHPLEHCVPSRCETGGVGHLAARDERERRARRDAEEILEPLARNLLDDRGRRAAHDESSVLIPRRGQPVGGEGGRKRPADDEAEVAAARDRDDARLGRERQLLDYVERIGRLQRSAPPRLAAQLVDARFAGG